MRQLQSVASSDPMLWYGETYPLAQRPPYLPASQTSGMAFLPYQVAFSSFPVFLPSFLPLLGWRRSLPNQGFVGQPLASDGTSYTLEAVSVLDLTGIVSENFFVQISEQMEGFYVYVGPLDGSFQE